MPTTPTDSLRFLPTAVEGLPSVTEVAVFTDRLELLSAGKWGAINFLSVARWHRHGWLYRALARLGFKVLGWPTVGERDWFRPPGGKFIRFFTTPPITVFFAGEPSETSYGQTLFRRVQDVMAAGGFGTFDLG